MLQWMGGSRRKVTTSRKSTQKRQKQYFEQRRRQQQQTAGLDSYSDCKEHRSLDILSLLNLSTAAHERKSTYSNEEREDPRFDASTVNYDITKVLPNLTNITTPADSVEIKEAGTSSDYRVETVSPKIASFTAPDDDNNTFNGSNYEPDFWKATAEQQISVFDLLAEDGASGNLEQSPVCEAHVAFSVEGLGKVGTQTPAHSPQQTRRMFQYGSSPRKAARRPNVSEKFNDVLDDFELKVDVMMQEMNTPFNGNYSEFSTDVMNSRSEGKQKYSSVKDYALFDGCDSNIRSSFGGSDIFIKANVDEDLWDARPSFLDRNFFNEKDRNVPGKNWSYQTEEINFFKYGEDDMSDYVFEVPQKQRNRDSLKAMDRYNILESPSPMHQTSEGSGNFLSSKRIRYSAVGRNFGFRDVVSQPDWSYYEDARDNLSSLSEESCSSSAVRGEATKLPSYSTARQPSRRHKNTFESDGTMGNPKNIYVKETEYQRGVDIQQGSYTCGSGKGTRTSSQLKPKLFNYVNSFSEENFGAPQSWLFEEGYNSDDRISGFSSFCQTPKTKFPSLGSEPVMEAAFGGFSVPESHINAKSSFDGSKYGESVEGSPFDSFGSDFKFSKPFSHMNREGSPIFSKFDFGQSNPNLSFDSESEGRPGSFHVAGSHGERLFPDLSAQKSVSKEEGNKLTLQPDNLNTCEPGKQSCAGNDCLTSENMNASNTELNVLVECKEAKDGTSEQKESLKATYHPEPEEETSSSSRIPDKCHSSIDNEEYNKDARVPLPCQSESKDVNAGKDNDVGPEQRKIVSKSQKNCIGSSLPVVMLESFVLQLLCVQKKL